MLATTSKNLALKAPITTAADDIHQYFFHCFSENIRLDVSSESSVGQRKYMKINPYFLRLVYFILTNFKSILRQTV